MIRARRVQYKANPKRKNGGGVSGSLCKKLIKGIKGPIKMILTGDRIVDTVAFQGTCDSDPSKDSAG
jgi:hypothetical protein